MNDSLGFPDALRMFVTWTALLLPVPMVTVRALFGRDVALVWSRNRRLELVVIACMAGAIAIVYRVWGGHSIAPPSFRGHGIKDGLPTNAPLAVQLYCCGMALVLAILFSAKLYEKWINRRLSDGERSAGGEGLRAWLGGANLMAALTIALCAWIGFDFSFWLILLVTLSAILAYPLIVFATAEGSASPAQAGDDLSPERERVLRLLEQGKITAEESGELLGALAATVPPPALQTPEPWTLPRKLMIAGALLVLVGFYLPWFQINPGQEVQRMMSQSVQPQMGQFNGMQMPVPAIQMPPIPMPTTGDVSISGGDIGHGLGWAILLLGVGAAAMPYIVTGLRRDTRWKLMLASIVAAMLIAVYLLTENPSSLSMGLPIVLAGLILEGVAIVREHGPANLLLSQPLVTA